MGQSPAEMKQKKVLVQEEEKEMKIETKKVGFHCCHQSPDTQIVYNNSSFEGRC